MADYLGGAGYGLQPVQQGHGIVGTLLRLPVTILEETIRDFTGAAKLVAGATGSVFDTLGFAAPITMDDVTARDIRGAWMLAGMAISGGVTKALSGSQVLKRVGDATTAFGRMKQTAVVQAAAGAAFGAVAPGHDMGRAESALINAGMFSALGAGASLTKSAYLRTVGLHRAQLQQAEAMRKLQTVSAEIVDEQKAARIFGVTLESPNGSFGVRKVMAENPDGSGKIVVRASAPTTKGQEWKEIGRYDSFGQALASQVREGFIRKKSLARVNPTLAQRELIPQTQRDLLERGNLQEILDNIDLRHYKEVREAAAERFAAAGEKTAAEFEALTEIVDVVGVPMWDAISPHVKEAFAAEMGWSADRIAQATTKEVLEEGFRRGVVSPQNMLDGVSMREMVREALVNEMIPHGGVLLQNRQVDGAFLRFFTSTMVGKKYVELRPLIDEAMGRQRWLQTRGVPVEQFMSGLVTRLGDVVKDAGEFVSPRLKQIVQILDDVNELFHGENAAKIYDTVMAELGPEVGSMPMNVWASVAMDRAKKFADPQLETSLRYVIKFVQQSQLRWVAAGRLGVYEGDAAIARIARRALDKAIKETSDGLHHDWVPQKAYTAAMRALRELPGIGPKKYMEAQNALKAMVDTAGQKGYFPLHIMGSWRAQLAGGGMPARTMGVFKTREEAEEFVVKQLKAAPEDANMVGSVTLNDMPIDNGAVLFNPKQFRAVSDMLKKQIEERGQEITQKEVQALMRGEGLLMTGGGKGKKFSPFLQPRSIRLREFSVAPFDVLRMYAHNMERTLAWNDFEQVVSPHISSIVKPNLRAWADRYVQDMLGRPHKWEIAIDNLMARFGYENKFIVRNWARKIRYFQTNWRLGGITSATVNATQYLMNVVPKLGKDSVEGLRVIWDKKAQKQVQKLTKQYDIPLTLVTPMSETRVAYGGMPEIQQLWKEGKKLDALSGMWLFAFNGAERVMRNMTFYAAFKQSVKTMPEREAVAAAWKITQETLFDYSFANTPQILRNPIGSVLGQFRQFFIQEMEFISGLNGKELARFAASMHALGGLALLNNIPGADLVNSMQNYVFDRNLEETVKLKLGDAGPVGRLLTFGMPGLLLGTDLSEYVGVGGFGDIMKTLAGPTVTDLRALKDFLFEAAPQVWSQGKVADETWNRGMQKLLPAQLRRIYRAHDILATGEVRNSYTGKLIYKPDERAWAAAQQAIGFPAIKLQQERAMDAIITRKRERYIAVRSSLGKKIGLAMVRGDQRGVAEGMAEAQQLGIVFTPASLKGYRTRMMEDAPSRRKSRTPKDLQAFFEAEGFFETDI